MIPIHDKATRIKAGNGLGIGKPTDPCPTLDTGIPHSVFSFAPTLYTSDSETADPVLASSDKTYSQEGRGNFRLTNCVDQGWRVRRLMPLECERLQGFPDNYTQIEWNGKSAENCPDGHRYKAIGNSMPVPVMRWIGERIQKYDT